MKYKIFGIGVDKVNIENISTKILKLFDKNHKSIVFYINAHSINIAHIDIGFKKTLNKADFTYCGGLGPVLAANLIDGMSLAKTTTPDFIFEIFDCLEKQKKSIYFLGATDEELDKMIEKIRKTLPKLLIKGSHHGYFTSTQEKQIIRKINSVKPDVLFVGMGSPKQEYWITEHYQKIDAKIFWSVGALFEVLSGKYMRLPKPFNDIGFEWVFRLLQEPRRLWKRYLVGNFKLLMYIIDNIKWKDADINNWISN